MARAGAPTSATSRLAQRRAARRAAARVGRRAPARPPPLPGRPARRRASSTCCVRRLARGGPGRARARRAAARPPAPAGGVAPAGAAARRRRRRRPPRRRARASAASPRTTAAWALVRGLQRGASRRSASWSRSAIRWAVDALLAAYHIAEFASVRAVLAEALGLAGDPRAGAALAGILPFGSEEERVRCCRALGRAAEPAMAPLVAAALQDEAWSVRAPGRPRARCDRASSTARPSRGSPPGLGDPAWWVRANCAEALRGGRPRRARGARGRARLRRSLRPRARPRGAGAGARPRRRSAPRDPLQASSRPSTCSCWATSSC